MCGSSQQQNNAQAAEVSLQQQQTTFMQTLQAQQQQDFAQNQAVLANLTATLQPIISAGPSQTGMSPNQVAALNTQATEGAAQAYRQVATAANEGEAAKGGGNTFIPSAAQDQLNQQVQLSAENNLSNQKLGITNANYNQGNQNFNTAVGQLSGATGSLEGSASGAAGAASGAASGANTAAGEAANEANSINASNNSWMGLLGGLASGVTNWATGGFSGLMGGGSSSGNGSVNPDTADGGWG